MLDRPKKLTITRSFFKANDEEVRERKESKGTQVDLLELTAFYTSGPLR